MRKQKLLDLDPESAILVMSMIQATTNLSAHIQLAFANENPKSYDKNMDSILKQMRLSYYFKFLKPKNLWKSINWYIKIFRLLLSLEVYANFRRIIAVIPCQYTSRHSPTESINMLIYIRID